MRRFKSFYKGSSRHDFGRSRISKAVIRLAGVLVAQLAVIRALLDT